MASRTRSSVGSSYQDSPTIGMRFYDSTSEDHQFPWTDFGRSMANANFSSHVYEMDRHPRDSTTMIPTQNSDALMLDDTSLWQTSHVDSWPAIADPVTLSGTTSWPTPADESSNHMLDFGSIRDDTTNLGHGQYPSRFPDADRSEFGYRHNEVAYLPSHAQPAAPSGVGSGYLQTDQLSGFDSQFHQYQSPRSTRSHSIHQWQPIAPAAPHVKRRDSVNSHHSHLTNERAMTYLPPGLGDELQTYAPPYPCDMSYVYGGREGYMGTGSAPMAPRLAAESYMNNGKNDPATHQLASPTWSSRDGISSLDVDANQHHGSTAPPSTFRTHVTGKDDSDGRYRTHHYYRVRANEIGQYECPFNKLGQCNHKPVTLKCSYDKYIDSHMKPFRCKMQDCTNTEFSSTACLLRHEREAHGLHGHGNRPYLCEIKNCERSIQGNGFPRHWNLLDHMKRVHEKNKDTKSSSVTSPSESSTNQNMTKSYRSRRGRDMAAAGKISLQEARMAGTGRRLRIKPETSRRLDGEGNSRQLLPTQSYDDDAQRQYERREETSSEHYGESQHQARHSRH